MVNFNNCTHSGGGYLERSSVVNVVQVDQSDVEMQVDVNNWCVEQQMGQ